MVQSTKNMIQTRIKDLEEQHALMRSYLIMKKKVCDWHGVADAAMDIREINSGIVELRDVLEYIEALENSPRKEEKDEKIS